MDVGTGVEVGMSVGVGSGVDVLVGPGVKEGSARVVGVKTDGAAAPDFSFELVVASLHAARIKALKKSKTMARNRTLPPYRPIKMTL